MRPSLLAAQSPLTFTDYFKLNLDVEDVVAHFGFTYLSQKLTLPQITDAPSWLADLMQRIETSLPNVSINNETARREFLIAPIVLDLARFGQAKVRVELPVEVSEQLRGTLDYFLQGQASLLIIEAKNADLQRGFAQLAAELIALDQWLTTPLSPLYGAVSIGNVWQFGVLERTTKRFAQDLNLFRVPADLSELVRILMGILAGMPTPS